MNKKLAEALDHFEDGDDCKRSAEAFVAATLKVPSPHPWCVKQCWSEDGGRQKTEILLDHPDYTAVLEFWGDGSRLPQVLCLRKDLSRRITKEEALLVLSSLLTPGVKLSAHWDPKFKRPMTRSYAIKETAGEQWSLERWEESLSCSTTNPPGHWAISLCITPAENPPPLS